MLNESNYEFAEEMQLNSEMFDIVLFHSKKLLEHRGGDQLSLKLHSIVL